MNYKLYFHPDLNTKNFTGQEVIYIRVIEPTYQIILHSNLLEITQVYVVEGADAFGRNLEIANYMLEPQREFLIINMVEELRENTEISLGILFQGVMKDKIVGLYSSSYIDATGNTR